MRQFLRWSPCLFWCSPCATPPSWILLGARDLLHGEHHKGPVHWHVSTWFNTMQVLNVLCCCTAPPSCTFLEQCKQRVVGDGACWCISMDFVLGCMGCQITHFITWFTESFASSPMTLSGLDSCVGRCHVLTLSSATVKTEPHWWFHVEVGSYSWWWLATMGESPFKGGVNVRLFTEHLGCLKSRNL